MIKVVETEAIFQLNEERYSTQLMSSVDVRKPGIVFWNPLSKEEFEAAHAKRDARCIEVK